MQVPAPAKINLSFEIQSLRPDGFHEIETLMTPITLRDLLTIERDDRNSGVHFRCDDPSVPGGTDNLVVQAASLFLARIENAGGVRIELEKRIPHGAGLGGGSSDAAATLLGLNELFAARLDGAALLELAAQIGSDVPFFIERSAAICRGRGELVTPTQLARKFPLLLIKPSFGVPTPWAYARWKNSRALPGISYAAQEFSDVRFGNDLERPVFEKYIFLARLKMWLLEQSEVGAALMSGSGSTIFAVLREKADAVTLAERARRDLDPELWTFACETI